MSKDKSTFKTKYCLYNSVYMYNSVQNGLSPCRDIIGTQKEQERDTFQKSNSTDGDKCRVLSQ